MVKTKGPTEAQIEAARKLLAGTAPKVATAPQVAVVDPDPQPTPPSFSGKDADFPVWVQADMRYKEAYSGWMARRRKL